MNILKNQYVDYITLNSKSQRAPKANFKPSFGVKERTFVMLKPDSFERGFVELIEDALRKQDLTIVESWTGNASRKKLEQHYREHRHKPFFGAWIDYLQSGNVKAMVVEGDDAIYRAKTLKLKIRAFFAPNQKRENLIHSSDTPSEATREIENFFGDSTTWEMDSEMNPTSPKRIRLSA